MIESSERLIVAQPMFSIVKVLSQSQPFGGFLVFLLASAGPKLSDVALFSSVTRADAGLLTVTVKEQLPVSPFSLLATQLTVVTPAGNVEPEGGKQVTVAPSKVSLTVGEGYSTTARHLPASAFLMMLPGQMIAGGASETMTVAVAVLLAELSSGADELMVAVLLMSVPLGKGVFTVVTKVIVAVRQRAARKSDAAIIAGTEANPIACCRTRNERHGAWQAIQYRYIAGQGRAVIDGGYLISQRVAGFDNARRSSLADGQIKA